MTKDIIEDVHELKGRKLENMLINALQRSGYSDAIIFAKGTGKKIARSERAKARERRKKTKRYEQTKDIFSD